jgi:hypothetical protein
MNRTSKTSWESMSPNKLKKNVSTTPSKKQISDIQSPQPVYPTIVKVKDKLFVIPQLQSTIAKTQSELFPALPLLIDRKRQRTHKHHFQKDEK